MPVYTAKVLHDFNDSVWDVWVLRVGEVDGHARVVANGRHEAVIEACEVLGYSKLMAKGLSDEGWY